MAVPKKKTSKSKKRIRKATKRVTIPDLVQCPNCHAYTPAHKVCIHCGFFKGKPVLSIKEKDNKK